MHYVHTIEDMQIFKETFGEANLNFSYFTIWCLGPQCSPAFFNSYQNYKSLCFIEVAS